MLGKEGGTVHVMSRLMGLCLGAFLTLALLRVTSVRAGERAGAGAGDGAYARGAAPLAKVITFPVTDQLSAHTQAEVFPRRDVAFSLTHRLWARAPGEGGEAARPDLAFVRLSQRVDVSGPHEHAFTRLAPAPLWADLLLEARVAPVSLMHLSTMVAYDPAEVRLARATAEVTLRPFTFVTLSLAPEFGQGSQLAHLTGRMQLTLPGAWTVFYTMQSAALDAASAGHTVTARYRTSYGSVRLQLARSPEETRAGVLVDLATFLHRTLGF
jgi:hypothetical protein